MTSLDLADQEGLAALQRAVDAAAKDGPVVDVDTLVASAAPLVARRAFSAAAPLLEAAVLLEPANPRAWALYGIALEGLSKRDDAIRAYEQALALDDDDPVSALALALLFERRGERGKARGLVRWIREIAPRGEIRAKADALERAWVREVPR